MSSDKLSPLSPLEIDAAWKGEELFARPEWQHRLTSAEIEELLAVARRMQVRQDATAVVPDRVALPRLAPRLGQIQELLESGAGAVRVRGFPPEDLSLDRARSAFWAVCRHIGMPVSQSAQGERIFSVRDSGLSNDDARARGPNTRKPLSFHTDRCDVIAFLCYRQAQSGGENQLVSSVAIFNHLLTMTDSLVSMTGSLPSDRCQISAIHKRDN